MTTSNKLEIRAIALDELGIYLLHGENQIDVDDMAQPFLYCHLRHTEVRLYHQLVLDNY